MSLICTIDRHPGGGARGSREVTQRFRELFGKDMTTKERRVFLFDVDSSIHPQRVTPAAPRLLRNGWSSAHGGRLLMLSSWHVGHVSVSSFRFATKRAWKAGYRHIVHSSTSFSTTRASIRTPQIQLLRRRYSWLRHFLCRFFATSTQTGGYGLAVSDLSRIPSGFDQSRPPSKRSI